MNSRNAVDPVLMSKTPGLCDCFCSAIKDEELVLVSALAVVSVRALGEIVAAKAEAGVGSAIMSRDHSFFGFVFIVFAPPERSVVEDSKTHPWQESRYITAAAMFSTSSEEPSLSDSNRTLVASSVEFMTFGAAAVEFMPLAAVSSAFRAA